MKALIDTADKKSERAFLVGVELRSQTSWDVSDSLDELSELATTAGVEVVGQGVQRLEARLREIVAAGRSTPGPRASNAVEVALRKPSLPSQRGRAPSPPVAAPAGARD